MKLVEKKSVELCPDRWAIDLSFYWKVCLQAALLVALFMILYAPTLAALVRMWWASDDYSHGFLVPFISLYFVWMKRKELSRINVEPSLWSGVPLILLAGLMLVASRWVGFIILQEFSLLVMIAGLVLLLAGKAFFKALVLPIGYLVFMINPFGEGGDRFHWPFQLLAANIGFWILQLFGFSAFLDSNYIHLPNVILEVAAACSGIRFLISIIAIGVPLAAVTQKTWPRRIGLVTFAVLVAILANGVRVALIGMWTASHGTDMLHGPFHVFYGVFVSWIGFIALFGGAWFLNRRSKKDKPALSEELSTAEKLPKKLQTGRVEWVQTVQWNRSWFIAVLILVTTGSYAYLYQISSVPLKKSFGDFPTFVGDWFGQNVDPKFETLKVTNTDAELVRRYTKGDHSPINLYVGYFNSQTVDKKLVTYMTARLFHRGEEEIDIVDGSGRSYRVNRVILKEGDARRAVLFWYDLNGRIEPNRYRAKLWSIGDALFSGRTNAALVALSVPIREDSNLDQIFKDQTLFFHSVMTPLQSFLYAK